MKQQTSNLGGSFVYPASGGERVASSIEELDLAVQGLQQQKEDWAGKSIQDCLGYLDRLIQDFTEVAAEWVDKVAEAQDIRENEQAIGTEWMQGPYTVLRNLQSLKQSMREIQSAGVPRIPGSVTVRRNGQVCAQVFPQTFYDRILFNGYRAEVWMEEGVTPENLPQTQALAYRSPSPQGKVSLVLGAGNLSAIPVTDTIDRLFVQKQVVVLKMNPVINYLGPVFERGFHCLIEAGILRIVYGGANEGSYLCQHPGVDEIFITGSDKTFDAIVFGSGTEGMQRKREQKPLINKPIYGELGNVTPAIIVPGEWSQEDLEYQAENLTSWLTANAGSACNTPRVIILQTEWPQRTAFLDALRRILTQTPLRRAFYPGSLQRFNAFMEAHPEAEQYGNPREKELPWTIIPDLGSENCGDICFSTESFCSVVAITPISAASLPEYLEKAVRFANQELWGTLAAGLFVHPESLKDPRIQAAVEKTIEDLLYGTIGVNCAAGLSWVMMTTPWGAFPGSGIYNIQSGNSFVHNTLMFSKPQKIVLYAKFRENPKPIAFPSRGKVICKIGPVLVKLMSKPSIVKLLPVIKIAFG